MQAADFKQEPVAGYIARAHQLAHKKTQFSDIIDAEGNQYVDLVLEGGGVLGIALVGYTYILEQAGLRFLGLGGTSAGSINALMIAALGPPQAAKSERLLDILSNMPIEEFVDGDQDARDFSQSALNNASMLKMAAKGIQIIDNLRNDLGLNPGTRFYTWLHDVLTQESVPTTGDLKKRLATIPEGLRTRDGQRLTEEDACFRLALIAADITTETKVEFPKMAELYWSTPDLVSPAVFARASMSVPLFFHPFRVANIPPNSKQAWRDLAGYHGELPTEALFIDGGIMSNFPINLFHKPHQIPNAPTFGVKIGADRDNPHRIESSSALLGAIFNSARHTLDFDFIVQNPDYHHLVAMINTGEHNWLDFHLSDDAKLDLFARGAEAAIIFLEGFDWPKYKGIRRELAASFLASVGEVKKAS